MSIAVYRAFEKIVAFIFMLCIIHVLQVRRKFVYVYIYRYLYTYVSIYLHINKQ